MHGKVITIWIKSQLFRISYFPYSTNNVGSLIEYIRPFGIFPLSFWSAVPFPWKEPHFFSAHSLPYIHINRWNSLIISNSSQKNTFTPAYLRTLRVINNPPLSFISNHLANHSNSPLKLYLPSNYLLILSTITTWVHTPSWIISYLDNYNGFLTGTLTGTSPL